ncbi:DEAD/DEAH box helicase family protein [Streptomyces sp. NPDC015032]|uniref:DEAD/DEAH box helicase family protein n=1 Tax=Streptomyces sp. NPDC015032 TaxID=3364937 RepID=UPI0036FE082B
MPGDTYAFVLRQGAPTFPGVQRDDTWGYPVFRGRRLPKPLAPWAAQTFSWEWLIQDVLNGRLVPPPAVRERPALRPHQTEPVRLMMQAYQDRAPGFLLAYPTGSGKTAMAICGALGVSSLRTVLVVTRLDVVPAWRNLIRYFGSGGKRWVVIHPEQLWRLFKHPLHRLAALPAETAAAYAAASGVPRVVFDAVILDESHMLADPMSQRSQLVDRLTAPDPKTKRRPWCVWTSATPFSSPVETGYASALIAHAAGVAAPGRLARGDYVKWLGLLGFELNKDKGRWTHDLNRGDVALLDKLLYSSGVGASASAEELGLPMQTRELRPVELPPGDQKMYEAAWNEFQAAHGLDTTHDNDPREGDNAAQSEPLRNVQKASLLKAPQVAQIVAGLVEEGCQVVVPAWYLDSISAIARHTAAALKARGLPDRVVEITGADRANRELKRQAFQGGLATVAVVNALEGINLQAGERGGAGRGRDATKTPRACVIADVLTGGRRTLHAEGRTQRDGQRSLTVYVYVPGTTEEAWLARTLRAAAGTQALKRASEDARVLNDLAAQLVAPDAPEEAP